MTCGTVQLSGPLSVASSGGSLAGRSLAMAAGSTCRPFLSTMKRSWQRRLSLEPWSSPERAPVSRSADVLGEGTEAGFGDEGVEDVEEGGAVFVVEGGEVVEAVVEAVVGGVERSPGCVSMTR